MLFPILVATTYAQECDPALSPCDMADDVLFWRYDSSVDGLGDDRYTPNNQQIYEGTISVRQDRLVLGRVHTQVVVAGLHHLERWVLKDPASQEAAADGFELVWIAAHESWPSVMNGYQQQPGWQDFALAEQDLFYKSPPPPAQIDAVLPYVNPSLTLQSFELHQPPDDPTIAGYLLRERRVVQGEVEWVDHWMLTDWTLLDQYNPSGSVVPTAATYPTLNSWLNAMQSKPVQTYARAKYAYGALGD